MQYLINFTSPQLHLYAEHLNMNTTLESLSFNKNILSPEQFRIIIFNKMTNCSGDILSPEQFSIIIFNKNIFSPAAVIKQYATRQSVAMQQDWSSRLDKNYPL